MEADHHDPFHEATVRVMERLMALGVLVEAGSRLAAENTRGRTRHTEQQLPGREAAARRARRVAAEQAAQGARRWAQLAGDPRQLNRHLEQLTLPDLARHWTDAARHADQNPTAAVVLAATEEHLNHRVPELMDYYRQQRDDGVPRIPAMASAAWLLHRRGRGPARGHPGRPATAGALTQIGADLERELHQLVEDLDPIARARLLHTLESQGWSAQSLSYVQTVLDRNAGERHAQARTPDSSAAGAAAAPAPSGLSSPGDAPRLAAQSFPVPADQALVGKPDRQSPAGRRVRRIPFRRSL